MAEEGEVEAALEAAREAKLLWEQADEWKAEAGLGPPPKPDRQPPAPAAVPSSGGFHSNLKLDGWEDN